MGITSGPVLIMVSLGFKMRALDFFEALEFKLENNSLDFCSLLQGPGVKLGSGGYEPGTATVSTCELGLKSGALGTMHDAQKQV